MTEEQRIELKLLITAFLFAEHRVFDGGDSCNLEDYVKARDELSSWLLTHLYVVTPQEYEAARRSVRISLEED